MNDSANENLVKRKNIDITRTKNSFNGLIGFIFNRPHKIYRLKLENILLIFDKHMAMAQFRHNKHFLDHNLF